MELTKEQLEGPAFAPIEPVEEMPAPVEPTAVEPTNESPESSVASEEASEEEPARVKYSRFKKVYDEVKELREKFQAFETKSEPSKSEEPELPEYWKKLYGDSEYSAEAWKIQSEQNEALISKARQEAIEAVRNERLEEAKQKEQNLEILDDHLEQVSAVAGHTLTEKEESTILDIIDDYTPKDKDGNYAGAMLSPDKAWEIYELKQQIAKAPKAQARDAVASLSNAQSQGEPSVEAEKNKSFNPLDWGSYKNRL